MKRTNAILITRRPSFIVVLLLLEDLISYTRVRLVAIKTEIRSTVLVIYRRENKEMIIVKKSVFVEKRLTYHSRLFLHLAFFF